MQLKIWYIYSFHEPYKFTSGNLNEVHGTKLAFTDNFMYGIFHICKLKYSLLIWFKNDSGL